MQTSGMADQPDPEPGFGRAPCLDRHARADSGGRRRRAHRQRGVALLKKLSYDVTSVQSAGEARRELDLHAFDVILLDVNMPEVSGLEMLVICKEKAPRAKLSC